MGPWPSPAPPRPRPPSPALEIDDLHVSVEDREILRGVTPRRRRRASSTRSWARTARASRPWRTRCSATPPTRSPRAGSCLAGDDITDLPDRGARRARPVPRLPAPRGDPRRLGAQLPAPGDRARARASTTTRCSRSACSCIEWTKRLGMDTRFQERYLNEGFSGGEKKRNEMLQMALLEPDDRGARRDRLRPRHRRAAPGRGRHRGGPQATGPQLGILLDHALPAHPRPPRAPTSCTC